MRFLRQELDLDQDDLGPHYTTVGRFEHGDTEPDEKTLTKIAAKLDTTIHEIDQWVEILNRRIKPAPVADSICPENNPDHISYYQKLEDILHQNGKMAEWILGNIDTFHAALDKPPQSATGRQGKDQQPAQTRDIFRSTKTEGPLSEKYRRRKPDQ